jgi:hypothetical protein
MNDGLKSCSDRPATLAHLASELFQPFISLIAYLPLFLAGSGFQILYLSVKLGLRFTEFQLGFPSNMRLFFRPLLFEAMDVFQALHSSRREV